MAIKPKPPKAAEASTSATSGRMVSVVILKRPSIGDTRRTAVLEDGLGVGRPPAAQAWLLKGQVNVYGNPFDDPPEAEAEAEPAATIYRRVPAALKDVDAAAEKAGVSANVWTMPWLGGTAAAGALPPQASPIGAVLT